MLKQGFGFLLASSFVVMELENDHPLACGRVADDDIAQESFLGSEVEEGEVVFNGVVAYLVANTVVQIVHQPALLDGQNLIESTSNMEADGGSVF